MNFWAILTFSSVKFFRKLRFKASKIVKTAVFDLLKSAKIDFMYNQSGRKITKFPHCGKSSQKSQLDVQVCILFFTISQKSHKGVCQLSSHFLVDLLIGPAYTCFHFVGLSCLDMSEHQPNSCLDDSIESPLWEMIK